LLKTIKEFVSQFKAEGSHNNHRTQTGQLVSLPGFKTRASRIQFRSITAWTKLLGGHGIITLNYIAVHQFPCHCRTQCRPP